MVVFLYKITFPKKKKKSSCDGWLRTTGATHGQCLLPFVAHRRKLILQKQYSLFLENNKIILGILSFLPYALT